MAGKIKDSGKSRRAANAFSIAMLFFLSAVYALELFIREIKFDYYLAGVMLAVALIFMITIIRRTINYYKLTFNIPVIIFLYYTTLMIICDWQINNFFTVCLIICSISCIYLSFNRTLAFILFENIFIGILLFFKNPLSGAGAPVSVILINWAVFFFAAMILVFLTRAATIVLNRALEHQQSFMDLLATTENYVAMVDERNEIVYASKTLATMGNAEDQTLVQGRPILDLFPGRSLKIFASKLLKDKDDYAEDWEFSLNGQKRYFKAASHKLAGGSGGTLINLYDMTHLAERDEIAVMKDSMRIGLFFMNDEYVIQDHYSSYLEEMLYKTDLFGTLFTDVIADSVSSSEMEAIKDYLKMVIERTYDDEMLEDINPLSELRYVHKESGSKKVFQFIFATVERAKGEVFILVTVYDITARVELQERLAEEEARRQEEMQAVFEIIQVQPDVFGDFMDDMEHEFDTIDKIQKNESLTAHEALVKIYQSIHAIKSNAVILGLNIFGNKVHNLESKIKKLREMEGEVPFGEMLNLTMDIEKISNEREGFRDIIDKLKSYTGGEAAGSTKKQNIKVLVDSLAKTTSKAAEDQEKIIQFVVAEMDPEAIDKGPRRVIKEILMQLIRNSAVHGIELPDVRKAKGKKETGLIKLSIKVTEDHKNIVIKLSDDGNGLDYKKIGERALSSKLIKEEDLENRDALSKVIFMPGFSTAETEGVHAGRGIGLNLVRDRVKEINGSVRLRSEDGKGIIFLINIPLA